jgi:ApaG protein
MVHAHGPELFHDASVTKSPAPVAAGLHRGRALDLLARVPSAVTENVRVDVESFFLPDQSDPAQDRYVFAYRIRITNDGRRTVQLMRRHWYIDEGDGTVREVEGDGVVGDQPIMDPGQSHEYTSGAVIHGPCGSMYGTYRMHDETGEAFDVEIPLFRLDMPRTLH